MDDQTTVNRRTPHRVRKSLGDLVHDALTLAELQVELLKVDLRDARRGVTAAITMMCLGAVLALGCIPVVLFAAAQALVVELGWPAAWAYLAVGAGAALLAGLLVWLGARRAAGAMRTVQRSKSEFAETLRWFKGSLHQTQRSELDAEMDAELWRSRA